MKWTPEEVRTLPAEKLIPLMRIVKLGEHIQANVGDSDVEEITEILKARKDEIIAEIDRQKAEKEAAKNAEREAEFIPYEVYSTDSYGIYNGFPEYHEAIKQMLEVIIPPESGRFDLHGNPYRDAVLRTVRDRPNWDDLVAQYLYKPFPVKEGWGQEYKDKYMRRIEEKTAPGTCMIPRDVAERMLAEAATYIFTNDAPKMIAELERDIRSKSRFVCKDIEDVRDARKRYNDINNDGGEGYIPPYCTQDDIDALKERLAFWKKYNVEE